VFFSHYKYFISFLLALVVFLVFTPLFLGFWKTLAGLGSQIEAVRHSIASLMGPLLAAHDPTVIAVFSAMVVIAMVFDEIRWGVAEHILCVAPISIRRLILLKSLICVLLTVPMALCIVAIRILFIYLFIGPHYLCYIAPLHVALLIVNSFTTTIALASIYTLLVLLTPSKHRTALNVLAGIIPVILVNTVVLRVLQEPTSITVGDLYTYTAIFATICIASVALGYIAIENMRNRIALNVIAP